MKMIVFLFSVSILFSIKNDLALKISRTLSSTCAGFYNENIVEENFETEYTDSELVDVFSEKGELGFVKDLPPVKNSVIVAVIDGGFDYEDQDFLKVRSDILSQDVLPNVTNEERLISHGSSVAEIISNINPKVKILGVPTPITPSAISSRINFVSTISEVKVINLSIEGIEPNKWEERAIKRAVESGKIVVISAGNHGVNLDKHPRYPASYGIPGTLIVGNHDPSGRVSDFSNYGGDVDYFLPGEPFVLKKGIKSGTSMSAAVMSGVISRVMADNPNLSNFEILKLVEKHSLKLDSKSKKGVINLKSLLNTDYRYGSHSQNEV